MLTFLSTKEARVAIEPGFTWDSQDAYLFDIDGTLLRSRDRVHIDSFASSVHRVTGFEITLAGILLHGSTDTAILREACNQAGVPASLLEARIEAILEAMRHAVAERRHELDLVRMPGVEQALDHLARKGALLGHRQPGNDRLDQSGRSRAAPMVPLRGIQRPLPHPRGTDRPGGKQGTRDGGPRSQYLRGGRHSARY
jgi:hypothetical protein